MITWTFDLNKIPNEQNLTDSAGNPREWWLLVEGNHAEIWFVCETRIYAEIQEKILNRGWNEKEGSPNPYTF